MLGFYPEISHFASSMPDIYQPIQSTIRCFITLHFSLSNNHYLFIFNYNYSEKASVPISMLNNQFVNQSTNVSKIIASVKDVILSNNNNNNNNNNNINNISTNENDSNDSINENNSTINNNVVFPEEVTFHLLRKCCAIIAASAGFEGKKFSKIIIYLL